MARSMYRDLSPFFKLYLCLWTLAAALSYQVTFVTGSLTPSVKNDAETQKIHQTPNESQRLLDFTVIHDYQTIVSWLMKLQKEYKFVKIHQIGFSAENRSLLVVEIDPPSKQQLLTVGVNNVYRPNPAVFIDAGTHGREQITVTVALSVIDKIVNAIARNDSSDFSKVTWFISPVVNPDGYEYSRTTTRSWRKNRSLATKDCVGVDVNRNWDFQWGTGRGERSSAPGASSGLTSSLSWIFKAAFNPAYAVRQLGLITPCSELFAGRFPFSEAEARHLSQFLLQLVKDPLVDLQACFSLHSMTGHQQLLFPYGYTQTPIRTFMALNQLAKQMTDEMWITTKRRYEYGSIATTLYETGGLQADWLYDIAGINRTFVIEMRDDIRKSPSVLLPPAVAEFWTCLGVLLRDLI